MPGMGKRVEKMGLLPALKKLSFSWGWGEVVDGKQQTNKIVGCAQIDQGAERGGGMGWWWWVPTRGRVGRGGLSVI